MEAIRNREYDPTFEERQRALDSLRRFQDALEGEAERLGLHTEEDVVRMIKEMRMEMRNENSR